MNIQTIILSLTLFLFPLSAFAGAGHDHGPSRAPATQSQAEKVASDIVFQLAEKSKIEASWKAVKIEKSLKKKFGNNLEWVVSFKNEKITDPAKQTLYIFLTLGGEYLAANYTGD
ncbi:MAG: hypothetical protein ISR69_06855 [Gammaproteobacteria bacterium]|nr:hypothetical protein [Gammaproteobacteria bacterium]